MPGAIPHLVAATAMFIIGRYYFKSYFDGPDKTKKISLLAVVCLVFSFITDFFLIIYYTTHVSSFCAFLTYHNIVHFVSGFIAIIALLILKFFSDLKSKPLWIMGMWCILLHLTMDLIIPDTGIWL